MSTNRKAVAQRRHANRRALERFGVCLEDSTIRRIIQEIQSGTARHIRKQSHRISLFESQLAGQPCVVAYDRQRKTIATVWPGKDAERPV